MKRGLEWELLKLNIKLHGYFTAQSVLIVPRQTLYKAKIIIIIKIMIITSNPCQYFNMSRWQNVCFLFHSFTACRVLHIVISILEMWIKSNAKWWADVDFRPTLFVNMVIFFSHTADVSRYKRSLGGKRIIKTLIRQCKQVDSWGNNNNNNNNNSNNSNNGIQIVRSRVNGIFMKNETIYLPKIGPWKPDSNSLSFLFLFFHSLVV